MSKPVEQTGAPTDESDAPGSSGDRHLHRIFVDAIDDQVARIMWTDQVFTIPVSLMPPGTREGAWLDLSIARANPHAGDPGEGEGEKIRARLAKDDPGGDIKL